MVDVPLLSRFDFHAAMRRWQVQPATAATLSALTPAQRERSVVLVQDAFTRYFEAPLLADLVELISRLGYQVYLAPFNANGKPLHVQGFLSAFNRAALRNARQLRELADIGVPLLGLDPAMTLVYRQEYLKVPGMEHCPEVALVQEWLLKVMPQQTPQANAGAFRLLAHCTEKTNAPAATRQWEQVFERVGLSLATQATGCCGMSGTYGHEARNRQTSAVIYEQSWARQIAEPAQRAKRWPPVTHAAARSSASRIRRCAIRCRCCWRCCVAERLVVRGVVPDQPWIEAHCREHGEHHDQAEKQDARSWLDITQRLKLHQRRDQGDHQHVEHRPIADQLDETEQLRALTARPATIALHGDQQQRQGDELDPRHCDTGDKDDQGDVPRAPSQNSSTPLMIVLSAPLPSITVFITGSRLAGT